VIRQNGQLNTGCSEDALRKLASAVVIDPSPEVNLTFMGKATVRRALTYPVQKTTGIVLHTLLEENPRTSVFQIIEMKDPVPGYVPGKTPSMFYQNVASFHELRLDLGFQPVQRAYSAAE
jgi:hypothetical protein